jgi:hemolysin activation/secretion protein
MGDARYGYWLSLAMFSTFATPAIAQQAPPPVPPAAAAPPTREEIQRNDQTPTPQAPPTLQVESNVPRPDCPLSDARFKDIQITLSGAEFSGLRGVDPALLRASYADYLGKPEPIAIVCEIRAAADTILARAGYIAAVRVPPQKIADGTLHLDVVMAHVVALRVRGNAGAAESRIARYLQPIQDAPVFNAHDAERYLLLASDLPGYQVRLSLRPADGGQPGDVIGEIAVSHQLYSVDFNLQDYGSRGVGRVGGLLRAQFYGLTGMGDRTTIGVFSTPDFREQQVVQFSHDLRVGTSGLGFSGRFTYAWTRPSGTGIPDIEANTLVGELEANYPFIRKQTADLRGAVGFDYIDQDVNILSTLFTRDHLRVAYARIDADATDKRSFTGANGFTPYAPRWRVAGSLELRQGVSIFGATDPCGAALARCSAPGAVLPSRVFGDPTAFVTRFTGLAEYRLRPNLTIAFSPRAQYAPHALLSYEEFSGGTYTIGRGFDPGTVLGDSGIGYSLEVRYGSTTPRTYDTIAFEPYVFVDQAWAWNHDLDLLAYNPQRLISAGGGVRAAYGDKMRVDAGFAVPVDKSGPAGDRLGHVRFLISITTRLLPFTHR